MRERLAEEEDAVDRADLAAQIESLEERTAALRGLAEESPERTVEDAEVSATEERLQPAWQRAKENPQLLMSE